MLVLIGLLISKGRRTRKASLVLRSTFFVRSAVHNTLRTAIMNNINKLHIIINHSRRYSASYRTKLSFSTPSRRPWLKSKNPLCQRGTIPKRSGPTAGGLRSATKSEERRQLRLRLGQSNRSLGLSVADRSIILIYYSYYCSVGYYSVLQYCEKRETVGIRLPLAAAPLRRLRSRLSRVMFLQDFNDSSDPRFSCCW